MWPLQGVCSRALGARAATTPFAAHPHIEVDLAYPTSSTHCVKNAHLQILNHATRFIKDIASLYKACAKVFLAVCSATRSMTRITGCRQTTNL